MDILGQKDVAIEYYQKGIKELELGLCVDCWNGRGEVWERAQRLHEKMQTNLAMVRDRLQFLGNSRHLIIYYKIRILIPLRAHQFCVALRFDLFII